MKRKRTVATIVVAVIGGAAINAAVAVAIAICLPSDVPPFPANTVVATEWFESRGVAQPSGLTSMNFDAFGKWIALLDADQPSDLPGARAGGPLHRVRFAEFYRIGWPFLSFEGGWCNRAPGVRGQEWVGLAPLPPWAASIIGSDCVPLRPVAGGMLLNTAIYGALLWLLLVVPTAFRVHRRARRGCCTRCGYQLRNRAQCPECGLQSAASTALPN